MLSVTSNLKSAVYDLENKTKFNPSEVIQARINLVMAVQDKAGSSWWDVDGIRIGTRLISIPTCAHTHKEGVTVLINTLINQSINLHELLLVLQTSVSPLQQNCCQKRFEVKYLPPFLKRRRKRCPANPIRICFYSKNIYLYFSVHCECEVKVIFTQ